MATRKRTDLLVVHVTATPPHMDIGAKEIDAMHKARGWSGGGYHFIIRRNGKVEAGRSINDIGAHVAGYNSKSLGISMVGGIDRAGKAENNATDAQYESLEQKLRELQAVYAPAGICGHRDLSRDADGDGIIEPHEHMKACPCFDAIPWAHSKGLRAANIQGMWQQLAKPFEQPDADEKRIAYLQRLIVRAGYAIGPIDGIAGPKTSAAISQFQTFTGLDVTGQFDNSTVVVLRARFEKQVA